jgi:hypothetical protein
MIFGSFSSSTFLCLGIMLVIVGVLGYLISRKFQEQNHKIATMCELVTTMAQDLQMLKMQNAVDKIQHTLNGQGQSGGGVGSGFGGNLLPAEKNQEVCERERVADFDKLNYEPSSIQHKIVVSDDDASYDEDDVDIDEDNDDSSTLEEFDNLEGDEYESDDDIEITEINEIQEQESAESVDILLDEEFSAETKHIDIIMDAEELVDHRQQHHHDSDAHPHIVVNKLGPVASPIPFPLDEPEHENEPIELSATPTFTNNPMIAESLTKPKKSKPSRTSTAADEIAEGVDGLENFTGDYSRLNVAQLRKLVTDRGLSTHATKLKKTELLQLLGGVVELEGIDM